MLESVMFSPLKKIHTEKGDVFRIMRCDEGGFQGFGEVYLTNVSLGSTKGWKKHHQMTLNLIVIQGNVKFMLVDDDGSQQMYCLGDENYGRLTVPPGIWVAFEGLSESNMVINVANVIHSTNESISKPIDEISFRL